MVTIRQKKEEDPAAIRLVLEQAFAQTNEADLVDTLRCLDVAQHRPFDMAQGR